MIPGNALLPSLPDPVFQAWVTPVAADTPCGQDVSFSNEFESLKLEVDKNVSLHGGAGTDWSLVLRMATNILGKQGKDLWVICYGIMAAHESQGPVCCAAAISALNSLLNSCWDGLYPPASRLQRRAAPLQWLAARLEARIASTVHGGEKGPIDAIKNELLQLQAMLDARFGEKAPSFANLQRMLRGEVRRKSGRSHFPDSGGANAALTPPSAEPTAHVPDGGELLEAIEANGRVPAPVLPRLLRSAQDQCRQLAMHYLSHDPLDWRVVLLHRTALWATVAQLPPADAAGTTPLRPVPPDRVQAYCAAVENKRFSEILPQLESSAGQAPFWLDGHHLVARCLEGLDATAPLDILRALLVRFLNRFPELVRYKFQDGTPFASPRTMQWLDSLEAPSSAAGQNRFRVEAGEAAREHELLAESLAIRAEKGFQAGLSHLERVPPGRSRAAVRQGLLQARYCIASGNKKGALRLLHAIYAQLEKWELLDWEPSLSAGIISLLISLQPKERGIAADTMLSRLHWLHLGTAVGSFKDM